jgi:hypothetical protein
MTFCRSEYNDWDIAAGGYLSQIKSGLPGRSAIAFHIVDYEMGLALANQLRSPIRSIGLEGFNSLAFQQHTQNFT